jgi:hypothetical protein
MSKPTISDHFKGPKARWLHLYQRCLARVSNVSELKVVPYKGFVCFMRANANRKQRVKMVVKPDGLEFSFPNRVRKVLVSEPPHFDKETVILFRASVHTSKSQST